MKRLKQIFEVVMVVAILIGIIYSYAWAIGVNRIKGSNVSVGWGLVLTPNATDSVWVHVTGSNGLADSLVQLWTADSSSALKTMASARIWSLTVPAAGTISLPANSITNAMTAAIDSAWMTANSLGWGVFTAVVQESIQTSRFEWKKVGVGETYKRDRLRFEASTDLSITLTDHGDSSTLTFAYTGAGGGAWWGQHVNGSAISTDTMVWLPENGILLRQVNAAGQQDTIGLKIDTTTLKTQLGATFLNDAGGEINATNDFNFASMLLIPNLVSDSTVAVWSEVLDRLDFSLMAGLAANMSIYYPLTVKSGSTVYSYVIKYVSAGADQIDTGVVMATFPLRAVTNPIDSITFNFTTSSVTVGVTNLRVQFYKKVGDAGALVLLDSLAAFAAAVANTWEHKSITSVGTQIGAGNEFIGYFIASGDNAESVHHTKAKIYYRTY